MKLFSYLITSATLSVNVFAFPAPYADDIAAFNRDCYTATHQPYTPSLHCIYLTRSPIRRARHTAKPTAAS
jgi:hypothetical protein